MGKQNFDLSEGLVEKAGNPPREILASQKDVETVLFLTQAKPPSKDQISEKIERPVKILLIRAINNLFFAEKNVLPRFLSGASSANDHEALQLTEASVTRMARAFVGTADPDSPQPRTDTADISWTWQEALYTFFQQIGPEGENLLKGLAKRFPTAAANVAAFQATLSRMSEIDRLVAEDRIPAAFVAARLAVEDGLAPCASRFLRLAARFCPEPDQFETFLVLQGSHCSARFLAALELLRRGADGENFAGELPAAYGQLTGAPDPSPDGAMLWHALMRAPRIPACDGLPPPQIVVMPEGQADASPEREPIPAETATGPVLVLARAVEPPSHWFDLVAPLVTPSAGNLAAALPVTLGTRATWGAGADRLIGLESEIVGFLAGCATLATDLLQAANGNPTAAGRQLAEDRIPLRLFDYGAQSDRIECLHHPVILVTTPEADDPIRSGAAGTPGQILLDQPATATAAQVAAALRALLDQQDVEPNTPVLLLRSDVPYADDHIARMLDLYMTQGGRMPVAVRGLVFSASSGGCLLKPAGEGGALIRIAPLGLSCLGLADAIAALDAAGDRPAEDCVSSFPLGAIAWEEGFYNNGNAWSRLLRQIDADPEIAQAVYLAEARPLSEALMAEETRLGRALAPPQSLYLRKVETARQTLRAMLEDLDPLPAFEERFSRDANILRIDGRSEELHGFLVTFAPRINQIVKASPDRLHTFLHLLVDCGVQDLYGPLVAAILPQLAARDSRLVPAATQVLAGGAPLTMLATALTTAFLAELRRSKRRTRNIARLAEALAAHLDPETLLFTLRLSAGASSRDFTNILTSLRPFARKLLIDKALPPTAQQGWPNLALLRAALAPRDLLRRALHQQDKAGAIRALREMVSHDARLPDLLETLRVMPTETRALAITAHDWYYPAHLGTADIVTVATLLGDRAQLGAYLDSPLMSETRAIACSVLGNLEPLAALYASWAKAEGLRPLRFAGSDIYQLFESLVQGAGAEAPAPRSGPLVSVLMSTFNVDIRLLKLSLASLRAQSWADLEILILDDGSEAGIRAAIEEIASADPAIRFMSLPRNQGPYVGRNIGIAAARGDYIAIQDADDVAHPDRIAHQVALLEASPRAMATASGHLRIDRDGLVQFQPGFGLVADGTMSTLYRRSVFDLIGGFAPVRSRGDVEFRTRIRRALGPEAYRETFCPLVICYADAGTLSQTTRRDKEAALRAFRTNFTRRLWSRRDLLPPRPVGTLAIPELLQP